MNFLFNLKNITVKEPCEVVKLAGGKGFGLWQVDRILSCYPVTHIISSELFRDFKKNFKKISNYNELKVEAEQFIADKLLGHIKQLPDILYAVRSSATIEDSSLRSFAGMFETRLNVSRKDIPKEMAEVWLSSLGKRVKDYLNTDELIEMSVLIQPMIQPKFSGVCFSKHPLPKNLHEADNFLIELIPGLGDKLAQGQLTPVCLSGAYDSLMNCSDYKWLPELLSSAVKLEEFTSGPVDIEFAVDNADKLWILQQRPITMIMNSNTLDMTGYKKAYKRTLNSLDIEFLINGCRRHLASYLEVQADLAKWMVMITNKNDGQQELWINELVDESIVKQISELIIHDRYYLKRLETRYEYYHNKILNWRRCAWAMEDTALSKRLLDFFEFADHINAHYYAPMHVIEALSCLILNEMRTLDAEKADDNFFMLATHSADTLMQFFMLECQKINRLTLNKLGHIPDKIRDLPKDLQEKISDLEERYGFLNCHQPYENPYTSQEILEMIKNPQEEKAHESQIDKLKVKYTSSSVWQNLFAHLCVWLSIRNQQMEYLYYAYSKAAAFLRNVGTKVNMSLSEVWNSNKDSLVNALGRGKNEIKQFKREKLVIVNDGRKTLVSDEIDVVFPVQDKGFSNIKGRTVCGKGQIEGNIKVAFSPKDLETLSVCQEKTIVVTGMTTPDFVPLLIKGASALITDEGGILCHAAIIAREIHLPCIVGTGIASEKLRDGQKVKINLDKAEIEIIS